MADKFEASVLLETVDNYLIVGGRNCTYKNIKVTGKDKELLVYNAFNVMLKVFLNKPLDSSITDIRHFGEDTLVFTSNLNYNEIVEKWGSIENKYFDGLIRLDLGKEPKPTELSFDSFVEHESKNADKGLIDAIKAFKDSLDSRA